MDFQAIEQKWQRGWEEKKAFEVKESKKKKYYCLEMFPYPSASGLHMGHAFNYTIGDIYARFKRANGFNVLYPMGYDAFGLPAENAAIKAGSHPKIFTETAIKNFIKQQKTLGLSYDWSRILITSAPEYYKWNQYFFLELYKKGLVYRKKAAVNYCPKCQTVLANEQVHNGKCWRHADTDVEIKQLEQWFVKITDYAEELLKDIDRLKWPERIKLMQKNWIGKSNGIEINFKINEGGWPIFTTRPDTIFGVTFMVISCQHPRLMELVTKEQKRRVLDILKKIKSTSEKDLEELEKEGVFTGSYAINPMTNEKVPVYAGNFVVADYGSGMVMAVPAHDQRDFEFAKKYNIPIKIVITPNKTKVITIKRSLKSEFYRKVEEFAKLVEQDGLVNINTEEVDKVFELAKDNFSGSPWYIHSEGPIKKIFLHSNKEDKIFNWDTKEECEKAKAFGLKIGIKKEQLDFDGLRGAYIDEGILINSAQFTGIESERATDKISSHLEKQKFGKRTTQYKLRDWLVSRQRYWGTPIPIVYCDKCGILPVAIKQLPVLLPGKVEFGKGNPLATNKGFVNTRCPKCGRKAKRETDTMDTFFDSSWYFLRYCDNKNNKKPFDKKKIGYWMPVDQYIGGAEHACMHLIYARFFTKALRDLGFLKIDEPFLRLFNQGMLHGRDGAVMSKSRGNIVLQEEISEKYGIDTARLFLVSIASPDKDIMWNDEGIEGSYRFINKVIKFFENVKSRKSGERAISKFNKTVRDVTEDIDNFRYNLAVIKIREFFEYLKEEESREILEGFLKLLHPFCPHIAEELWHKIGNKTFISLEPWPKVDEKKINHSFEKQDIALKQLKGDINNVLRIINKQPKRIFIYAIPKDIQLYDSKELEKEFSCKIEIVTNNKAVYDPQDKAGKAKPGKPAIYIE